MDYLGDRTRPSTIPEPFAGAMDFFSSPLKDICAYPGLELLGSSDPNLEVENIRFYIIKRGKIHRFFTTQSRDISSFFTIIHALASKAISETAKPNYEACRNTMREAPVKSFHLGLIHEKSAHEISHLWKSLQIAVPIRSSSSMRHSAAKKSSQAQPSQCSASRSAMTSQSIILLWKDFIRSDLTKFDRQTWGGCTPQEYFQHFHGNRRSMISV